MKILRMSARLFGLVGILWLVSCSPAAPSRPVPILPTLTPISTVTSSLSSLPPASSATPFLPAATPIAPAASVAATSSSPLYALGGEYTIELKDFNLPSGVEEAGQSVPFIISIFYPVRNGSPDTAHGPYPLVIYAPGLDEHGKDYAPLLKSIASYGFVIATWNPRGEMGPSFWAGAATRPLDLQHIIAFADKATAPGGKLAGLIDTRKIAVAGISSGGWTALIGAGARMDLGWCTAHPDLVAKIPYGNCAEFVSHQQNIAQMLGLDTAPPGLWPAQGDPRVAAVVAESPDGDIWGAEYAGVAAVKVPALIMAGTNDAINPPELTSYPIYEHLGSQKKTLVVFEDADHKLAWDSNSDAIKHLMTAFLLSELKGDPAAAKALLPENAAFQGVKITTTPSGGR